MAITLEEGAKIVIRRWCRLKPEEKALIITDETHVEEAAALWHAAHKTGALPVAITIPESCSQPGSLIDDMADFMCSHDLVIGATNYSLITTKAVRTLLEHGGRFLSLPLSTNDNRSALTYDFMDMDPHETESVARPMLEALNRADTIHITTKLGTDLTFGKRDRQAGLFNGMTELPGKVGSSSFEIYMGVLETETNGRAVVDGSLGYNGLPASPIALTFRDGLLAEIQDSSAGRDLRQYMDSFGDPNIYVAGELGIGLNKLSRCLGACYIEDESTFSTFHIGMGRNLALGGQHDAAGHFDLVFREPTITADDVLIMKDGVPTLSY